MCVCDNLKGFHYTSNFKRREVITKIQQRESTTENICAWIIVDELWQPTKKPPTQIHLILKKVIFFMPFVFPILHRHLPGVFLDPEKSKTTPEWRFTPFSSLSISSDSVWLRRLANASRIFSMGWYKDGSNGSTNQTATHLCEISREHTSNTYQTGNFGMRKRKRSWYWEQKKNSEQFVIWISHKPILPIVKGRLAFPNWNHFCYFLRGSWTAVLAQCHLIKRAQ